MDGTYTPPLNGAHPRWRCCLQHVHILCKISLPWLSWRWWCCRCCWNILIFIRALSLVNELFEAACLSLLDASLGCWHMCTHFEVASFKLSHLSEIKICTTHYLTYHSFCTCKHILLKILWPVFFWNMPFSPWGRALALSVSKHDTS